MTRRSMHTTIVACGAMLTALAAEAQPLGTFTWRLEPFCNLVTVNVTQNGAVYTMDGYDDLCGAGQRAPVVGLATPNPDGTIGIGWNMVVNGVGLQVGGLVAVPGFGGPWSDSAGNSGHFVFGTATSGTPRPVPTGATTIPRAFALLTDGGFLARGTLSTGTIPASGPGARMMWHPGKAAFRVGNVNGGQWDDANVGAFSVAMGFNTIANGAFSAALGANTFASGSNSTALGTNTVATGSSSTAMGQVTTASGSASTAMGSGTVASSEYSTAMGGITRASGQYSTAMGANTVASGGYSTAMGHLTRASGESSTAMGAITTASGRYSNAMGFQAVANGDNSTAIGTSLSAAGGASVVMGVRAATATTGNGSFVYGDQSSGQSGSVVTSVSPNQFLVRAAGGTVFWSTAGTTFPTSPGVALYSGDSAWSTLSDVNSKENFRDLAGEDVLARLAAMPVREWNYKAQDATIRHLGPTAQDFHAAFGLGSDPRRIGTVDADGVSLAAVKALEARTRHLIAASGDLARDNAALKAHLARQGEQLRLLLARIDSLLDKR